MKEIQLTQGQVALVDDEDYEHLNQWKWYAHKFKSTYYAGRTCRASGKPKTIKMHREIMKTPAGFLCDHKDHNGLNNQKCNLRNCTKSENNANGTSMGSSKYLGVSYYKAAKKWQAYIRKDNKPIFLGKHDSENMAGKAYNEAALKYHGEFARLNIID